MKIMEEYEYISEFEFSLLINSFYNKNKKLFIGKNTYSNCLYEDSMIKIHITTLNALNVITNIKMPYRVDRKKFINSKDEMLRKYPNIVFSKGKYPDYECIVRYSKEAGYITPHIKRLLNDKEYLKEEMVMFTLEN